MYTIYFQRLFSPKKKHVNKIDLVNGYIYTQKILYLFLSQKLFTWNQWKLLNNNIIMRHYGNSPKKIHEWPITQSLKTVWIRVSRKMFSLLCEGRGAPRKIDSMSSWTRFCSFCISFIILKTPKWETPTNTSHLRCQPSTKFWVRGNAYSTLSTTDQKTGGNNDGSELHSHLLMYALFYHVHNYLQTIVWFH